MTDQQPRIFGPSGLPDFEKGGKDVDDLGLNFNEILKEEIVGEQATEEVNIKHKIGKSSHVDHIRASIPITPIITQSDHDFGTLADFKALNRDITALLTKLGRG